MHAIVTPGTISLPPELHTSAIWSIVAVVLLSGVKRLFVLNAHEGNAVATAQALAGMVAESNKADGTWSRRVRRREDRYDLHGSPEAPFRYLGKSNVCHTDSRHVGDIVPADGSRRRDQPSGARRGTGICNVTGYDAAGGA